MWSDLGNYFKTSAEKYFSLHLLNALSQMWQMKGLSPRCFLLCLVSSSDLENLQPQSAQGQVNGLSPV